MKRRKSKRAKRAAGRTMTVTTSSRVVKTTRMNPRGLDISPYRRKFKFGRDRHEESVSFSHSSKNIRKMMRTLFPGWTKEQHVHRLVKLSGMVHVVRSLWSSFRVKAHQEVFGKGKMPGMADYKVSGVGRDEYPERLKGRMRIAARQDSTIIAAIHAHALMAGKAAIRHAGMDPDRTLEMYKPALSNPAMPEGVDSRGTRYKLKKDTEWNQWVLTAYVDGKRHEGRTMYFAYDRHDRASVADARKDAESALRHVVTGKINPPHDARTAATQRIPAIRVMIPAGGGKDPRTAETRRLQISTSSHRKNPVRSLVVPRTMWKRLKRIDKKTKHGHRYVRCKTRRARRAFWLPCTVR